MAIRTMAGGTALGITLAALLAAPAASVSVTVESGDALFRTYCASCHGPGGKGDGPLAANLRTAPADLTRLARRAHGKFDAEKVRRAIDGRQRVPSHGTSDMPVWGDAFKNAAEGYSEERVKARIDALVDFLKTIQEK
jgi:mono/diheme cytochrome c family protein